MWSKILVILTTLCVLCVHPAISMSRKHDSSDFNKMTTKLISFSKDDLISFLNEHGYQKNFISEVSKGPKNSLVVYNWKNKKALIISCSEGLREISLKGRRSVVSDDMLIPVWFENGMIEFESGYKFESFFNVRAVDSNAKFFLKRPNDNTKTIITKVMDPQQPLAELDIIDPNSRIYSGEEEVFVVGFDRHQVKKKLKYYLFDDDDDSLKPKLQGSITSDDIQIGPFDVVDYDILSGDLLLIEIIDLPFRSKWHVFNIYDQSIKYLGKAMGYGFYLNCNPLK